MHPESAEIIPLISQDLCFSKQDCKRNPKMGLKPSALPSTNFFKKLFPAPKICTFGLIKCFFQNFKFLNDFTIIKSALPVFETTYFVTSIVQEINFVLTRETLTKCENARNLKNRPGLLLKKPLMPVRKPFTPESPPLVTG